jgi:hypothetical protein
MPGPLAQRFALMTDLLARLKPGVSRRLRLLLAAAAWTVVGLVLLITGARWSLGAEPGLHPVLFAAAVAVGLAKAAFVLRHAANRVIRRILEGGDDRCIGGFFSWRTWILVAIMIIAGGLLRRSDISHPLVGLVYVVIGTALLSASWLPWRAWSRELSRPPAGDGAKPT